MFEAESLRWSRKARHLSVLCLKNLAARLPGTLVQSHLNQRSGQNPNHILKKAISRKAKRHPARTKILPDINRVDRPHRRLLHFFISAKTLKIMRSDQKQGCLLHRFQIKRLSQSINRPAKKNIPARSRLNPVGIDFPDCI